MTYDYTPWWVGLVLALTFFAWFEARGLRHGARQATLSRWVYTIGATLPLSIFLMGFLVGGLAVHFFWHWCPDLGTGVGLPLR
jgi:hypothetical protein